jgi:hypothetical protein
MNNQQGVFFTNLGLYLPGISLGGIVNVPVYMTDRFFYHFFIREIIRPQACNLRARLTEAIENQAT